ncbi:MAG: glycosyl transferase family 2 [Hydrocarboniphaga sp.]|uniref:glycosyltransferase family 2 protein n=1 Tax=Hydrocarboniphaga sp. TaxID=2033016 RepID=UPI0026315866|nr:glycosyltransferase [Hydrocarboniphaga sp.]MDB5971337.1 glycosyl transferase family 2 [Hydrocarboniphaga sp.]
MNIEDLSLIVIPRERFSMARESLESLYANSPPGFRLIYVDGNAPREVRDYLRGAQIARGFELIRSEHYLSNNRARNLGLARVQTSFVVLVDNDLIFAPGWLQALMRCADETAADVVAPLICEGYPAHTTMHYAGGEYVPADELEAFHGDQSGQRELREKQFGLKQPLAQWRERLQRGATGFCEPHCMLARMSLLRRLGPPPFDEAMLATKEHLDFCMSVRALGGSIVFEPASMVTFMLPCPARPLRPTDLPFYFLRWSDDWQHRSLDHFRRKWRLGKTDFRTRYLGSGYRRDDLVRVYLRKLPLIGRYRGAVELCVRALRKLEKFLNRRYTTWYRWRHGAHSTVTPV